MIHNGLCHFMLFVSKAQSNKDTAQSAKGTEKKFLGRFADLLTHEHRTRNVPSCSTRFTCLSDI